MNQASIHKYLALECEKTKTKDVEALFNQRLATNFTLIKDLFFSLYPESQHKKSFKRLLTTLPALFKKRPSPLKLLDNDRVKKGNWYQSQDLVGMQLYVDHFNKDLKGLEEKLGYFEKLGVNFIHLMPITPRPKEENDGGYAVNSYHKVDQRYGTQEDLLSLTQKMRDKNMYLMLDFVANHTSNEYPWARKAIAGDLKYQGYYHIYPDRTIPDEFETTLPEIFPMTSPGNFTYNAEMQKWVMTVFNQYQWDLDYSNPMVFIEMLGNLTKLTDLGVDVVRLDALAFMWKKLGTESQNLPEAHTLISLFRMCLQVIAPGVVFLAEAIVAPKEIIKYFGSGRLMGNECEIAYNATLMALLWDAIATKKAVLLYKNIQSLPEKPKESTWINYIRCHDDIGLGFEDHHIHELGWNAVSHHKFLLDYYCQNIDWSPAKGHMFMYNPKTGDGRITGSAASLLGLEMALEQNDQDKIDQSIAKIIMMHAIILSYGGVPLIYAGDEIGTLNDYSYLNDSDKKEDSRWINRPFQDWNAIAQIDAGNNHQSQIFQTLRHLIKLRKSHHAFADKNEVILYEAHNPHFFIYERPLGKNNGVLVVCNFDEVAQTIYENALGSYGSKNNVKDLISGEKVMFTNRTLKLDPYQILWLAKTI